MLFALTLWLAPISTFYGGTYAPAGKGTAAQYRPWRVSRWVPYGRYAGAWGTKPTKRDMVCAHRTLPFGTVLRLTYKERSTFCVVLDRGPYGFCRWTGVRRRKGVNRYRCKRGYRWVVAVRRKHRGYYRGIIDATPLVHRMLGSRGWSFVTVEKLVGVKRDRRALRLGRSRHR